MTSLISIYTYSGKFIDHMLDTVTITKQLNNMDKGTLVLSNLNPKVTEDLILPGNFVVVEDSNLRNSWVGVISPPTTTNSTQTTIALLDPKYLLAGVPILSTAGLNLGTVTVQGISYAISVIPLCQKRRQFIWGRMYILSWKTLQELNILSGGLNLLYLQRVFSVLKSGQIIFENQ